MKDWQRTIVPPHTRIIDAIRLLDETAAQICLVVSADRRLQGTITDGDVRRGILRGVNIDLPVTEIMNPSPVTVMSGAERGVLLERMRRDLLRHLPLVDDQGCLVGLTSVDDVLEQQRRPNWVILMAGGEGQRLRPLTENTPKPLLAVGDRPILETIVSTLAGLGFHRFFLSVNYRADRVKSHFGDGSKWGVQVEYLHEDRKMGTAGALGLLPQRPDDDFLVMNGDILTNVDFTRIFQFHDEHGDIATMCVREYAMDIPYGVVELDGQRIQRLTEKPKYRFHVNAGLYVFRPDALDYVSPGEGIDMPELFHRFIAAEQTCSAFPIREYWTDIGRIDDFRQANDDFAKVFGRQDDL